jgi:hypothetical protein
MEFEITISFLKWFRQYKTIFAVINSNRSKPQERETIYPLTMTKKVLLDQVRSLLCKFFIIVSWSVRHFHPSLIFEGTLRSSPK